MSSLIIPVSTNNLWNSDSKRRSNNLLKLAFKKPMCYVYAIKQYLQLLKVNPKYKNSFNFKSKVRAHPIYKLNNETCLVASRDNFAVIWCKYSHRDIYGEQLYPLVFFATTSTTPSASSSEEKEVMQGAKSEKLSRNHSVKPSIITSNWILVAGFWKI